MLIHRRHEGHAVKQGINWTVDDYTSFQVVILIWRLKFYFRMRRKRAFDKFNKMRPRFICYFEFRELYRDGFCRVDRKLDLWENFDSNYYRTGSLVFKLEELPIECLKVLCAKSVSRRYHEALAQRGA